MSSLSTLLSYSVMMTSPITLITTRYLNHAQHINGVHCTERKYKCNHCDRSFKTAIVRSRHIENRHSEGRFNNFNCDRCARSFHTKRQLSEHRRAVHPTYGRIKCKECKGVFKTRASFKKHVSCNRK